MSGASNGAIRTVFMDLGGTLVETRRLEEWGEIARRLDVPVDPDGLAHALEEVEGEIDRHPPAPPYAAYWAEILRRAAGRAVPEETGARFVAALRDLAPHVEIFSDTRRCLDELAGAGYDLGVISNSRSEEHLRELLRSVGILTYFRVLVSSGTEGVAKPDPEIFRRALARAGAAASASFYVGDLPWTDAKAAQAAGLRAVWLNRGGTGFGDDPPEITSLTELPGYLRSLALRSRA